MSKRLSIILLIAAVIGTACSSSTQSLPDAKSHSPSGAELTPSASAPKSGTDDPPTGDPATVSSPKAIAAPPPLAPSAMKPAAPGKYTYDESGERSLGSCGESGVIDHATVLSVEAAKGSVQKSVWDRSDDKGGVKLTTHLEFRKEGALLVYLHQQQATPIGPVVEEFEKPKGALVFPTDPRSGRSWSDTLSSKDGDVTVDLKTSVESVSQAVSVGGGKIMSVRLSRITHVTGDSLLGRVDITETATIWISAEHRLILKETAHSEGTVGTCKVSTNITAVLRSTTPR